MNIGETIRTIRKEHGLSQEEMAEQFHVTRQSISNWENNRNYPDLATLQQISKRYQISIDTLLHNDWEYVRQNAAQDKKLEHRRKIILVLAVFLAAAATIIIILLISQNREFESGRMDLPVTSNMNIMVDDVGSYTDDPREISGVVATLSGDYQTLKQVIPDKVKRAFVVQLWNNPDETWNEVIVIDDRHIVYQGWKCRKIDQPIDLQMLEKVFGKSPE